MKLKYRAPPPPLPVYLDHILDEEEPEDGEGDEQRAAEDDERHSVDEDPRQQETPAALKRIMTRTYTMTYSPELNFFISS